MEVFLKGRYTSGRFTLQEMMLSCFRDRKKGGIPDMKNDDIELLREVQKNAEMGMHALEVINPKVYDDSMALMLARESFKYGGTSRPCEGGAAFEKPGAGPSQQGKSS